MSCATSWFVFHSKGMNIQRENFQLSCEVSIKLILFFTLRFILLIFIMLCTTHLSSCMSSRIGYGIQLVAHSTFSIIDQFEILLSKATHMVQEEQKFVSI
jgi:hypothetical protein